MHGLFVGRLRLFHLTFGWHNIFRTLTQKLKPEANAKHDIERLLSKFRGWRVCGPSARRTATAERRTRVEEEEVDRDKIEVAWDGFSVLTESLASAPAYSGEAFFVRVRDASSWGRTSSEDDQHTIEVGVCNTTSNCR